MQCLEFAVLLSDILFPGALLLFSFDLLQIIIKQIKPIYYKCAWKLKILRKKIT